MVEVCSLWRMLAPPLRLRARAHNVGLSVQLPGITIRIKRETILAEKTSSTKTCACRLVAVVRRQRHVVLSVPMTSVPSDSTLLPAQGCCPH